MVQLVSNSRVVKFERRKPTKNQETNSRLVEARMFHVLCWDGMSGLITSFLFRTLLMCQIQFGHMPWPHNIWLTTSTALSDSRLQAWSTAQWTWHKHVKTIPDETRDHPESKSNTFKWLYRPHNEQPSQDPDPLLPPSPSSLNDAAALSPGHFRSYDVSLQRALRFVQ